MIFKHPRSPIDRPAGLAAPPAVTAVFGAAVSIVTYGVTFAATFAACIAVPSPMPEAPMCATSAECDVGETCGDGICWGNPPAKTFGAILLPPADGHPDLAPTHLAELAIAADGTVGNLQFAETVTITGRVALDCGSTPIAKCDPDTSIAARISFTRPSPIPGQPPYTRTALSQAGLSTAEPSFSLVLPRSESEYQVSVIPTDAAAASMTGDGPAAWAPPTERVIVADRDMQVEWQLGAPDSTRELTGRVLNPLDQAVPGMQIFALRTGAGMSSDERISSITTSGPDGAFILRIPRQFDGAFDVAAVPLSDAGAPHLRARERTFSDPPPPEPPAPEPVDIGTLTMPGYGATRLYTVPVMGIDGNGDNVPIAGATVSMTTYLSDFGSETAAVYTATAFTDDMGHAELPLIPGSGMENRMYIADIEPLDGSEHTIKHAWQIDVGSTAGVLEDIQLDRRIAVAGQVLTSDGRAAPETTVVAALSPEFRDALDPDSLALIDALLLPSAQTDQNGGFVIWLDKSLAGRDAIYDLRLVPADSLLPHWSEHRVRMTETNEFKTVELGTITLPSASYARGIVTALDGSSVPGAQLRLFEILASDTCQETSVACRAAFRGLHNADESGQVMVVLPE